MPVSKSYTRAQWDAVVQALNALPEKPRSDQRVTVSDGMKEIRALILTTQAKGYTLEEIILEAERHGIEVGIGAVKYTLYRSGKFKTVRKSAKGRTRDSETMSQYAKKGHRGGLGQDNKAQAGSQVNGAPTRREGAAIQGVMGFPIRPDTENL